MSGMTRRGLLAVAGGTAAAALGWWFGPGTTPASRPADSPVSTQGYVDHDGWMLSVEDTTAIHDADDPYAELAN